MLRIFLKRKIKDVVYFFAGFFCGLLFSNKSRAIILMYHSIDANKAFFTVTPEVFELQLRYLKEKKYNVVSLDKIFAYIKSGKIPSRTVAITFDDGYADNFFHAFPLLKKYNMPADIFITTGLIGKTIKGKNFELPLMSEKQLYEISKSGLVKLYAHTQTHPRLTQETGAVINDEIRESVQYCDEHFNARHRFFAYPFGALDDRVKQGARVAGVEFAVTVEPGFIKKDSDVLAAPRNAIDSGVSLTQFKAILCCSKI